MNRSVLKELRELLERGLGRAHFRVHSYYERKLAKAVQLVEQLDVPNGPYPAPTHPGVYWAQWSFGSNPPKIERVVFDKDGALCIAKGTRHDSHLRPHSQRGHLGT